MSEFVESVFKWIDLLVVERIDKIISVILVIFAIVSLLRPFIRWMRHPVVIHTILAFLTAAVCVFAVVVVTQSGWSTLWDNPAAQFAVSVLIIVPLLAVLGWRRDRRVGKLKKERESQDGELQRVKAGLSELRGKLDDRDAQICALGDEVHGKEVEAARLAEQVRNKERQLSESQGRAQGREAELARLADRLADQQSKFLQLEQELHGKKTELGDLDVKLRDQQNEFSQVKGDLETKHEALRRDLQHKENELSEIDEELTRLEQADEPIWQQAPVGEHGVVPLKAVKTRFVSIINLKGGVGKTTLTANLAATLSLEDGLRILIVDLDFQGTLSDMAVDPKLLLRERERSNTVCRLLAPDFDSAQLRLLSMPMYATQTTERLKVNVIIADDGLEMADFRAQMRFLRDHHCDVRFLFRSTLRRAEIAEQFDLVIFDCPPRFTTSAVNALACSDCFLIPTKLDAKSVNAVPRTLKWISNLSPIMQPKLLGVVGNEAGVGTHLTSSEKPIYGTLKNIVRGECGSDDQVFATWVKASGEIAQTSRPGVVPSLRLSVRRLFQPVAKEFKERLGL